MRCHACKRPIGSGTEAARMICTYTQPDGTVTTYGHQMPAGPITAATGRLTNGWHNKCWHAARKREARGDLVHGRVLGEGVLPTGYTADGHDSRVISDRLAELNEIAAAVGKPVGDPTVSEAYRASQHGGPYTHAHTMPLDTYQLRAHLHYAHGTDPDTVTGGLRDAHTEAHARQAASAHLAQRAGEPEPAETDWRHQVAVQVDDLT